MIASLNRLRLEAEDRLRYSTLVRNAVGHWTLVRDRLALGRGHQHLARSIVRLCAAARYCSRAELVANLQERIRLRASRLDPRRVDWREFVPDVADPRSPRSVILKPWRSAREPGVVFVSFEKEWAKYLCLANLAEFAERYTLVVSPSSSPHNLINYVLPAKFPRPVFTLISHDDDTAVLSRVSANCQTVPLLASQWVDPRLFRPRPRGDRDIDLVMVAAWGKVKRHHVLFRALRDMTRHLNVHLIGQDQEGRTADTIRAEAAAYGVAGRFHVKANAEYGQVAEILCRAKASLLLSRREGSAVVVAESLFADTPVALLRDAHVGSRKFINESTGVFLSERNLAGSLQQFVVESRQYEPRAWAEKNISCFASTEILNGILRAHSLGQAKSWTQDIFPLCWRPDPCLVYPEHRRQLQEERADIQRRFGLQVGPWGED